VYITGGQQKGLVMARGGVGLVILLANVTINGDFKEGITLKVYKLGNRNKSPIAKIKNVKSVQ
jgi:hypothetical protein